MTRNETRTRDERRAKCVGAMVAMVEYMTENKHWSESDNWQDLLTAAFDALHGDFIVCTRESLENVIKACLWATAKDDVDHDAMLRAWASASDLTNPPRKP